MLEVRQRLTSSMRGRHCQDRVSVARRGSKDEDHVRSESHGRYLKLQCAIVSNVCRRPNVREGRILG